MQNYLSEVIETIPVMNPADGAAGQTTITSVAVDMGGSNPADGVRFLIHFGVVTAGSVSSVKARQDTASNMGTAADLAGTSQAVDATNSDNKLHIIDILHPQERYVDCQVLRATQNAVVGSIIAERYKLRSAPVTQNAGVQTLEKHDMPAEGTA